MRNRYPYLTSQIFNTSLLIHPAKLDAIWGAVGHRITGEAAEPVEPEAARPEPAGLADDMARLPSAHRYDITPEGVAVIPIIGTLVNHEKYSNAHSGMTGYANIEARLIHARESAQVRGILLAIDSPGGAVAGCFPLAKLIRETSKDKPVWAVADASAYSAAYALACAAQRVYVAREGGVGSIGVIAWHLDHSRWDEKEGLNWTPVYAGARKKDFNPHEPLSDKAQARLQADVDDLYGVFTGLVAKFRRLDVGAVVATEADTFQGPQAIKAGLADRIGSRRDTLADLTAKINKQFSGGFVRMAAAATGDNQQMEGNELPRGENNEAAATAQEPEQNAQGGEQMNADQVRAEARTAERKRVADIMGCEEAKGREALAKHLALNTDTEPEAVRGILAASAQEQAEPVQEQPGNDFARAMARESEGVEPNAAEGEPGGPSMADVMASQLREQGIDPVGR